MFLTHSLANILPRQTIASTKAPSSY